MSARAQGGRALSPQAPPPAAGSVSHSAERSAPDRGRVSGRRRGRPRRLGATRFETVIRGDAGRRRREGRTVRGAPEHVFLRGRRVVTDGRFTGCAGGGAFLKRNARSA